ncbi:MAG: glycosyltransferase family 1 protein [Opitutaceae bacterium]|nr:glycosyltransferase family 1 protein [Opitutaceae bacterium]
MANPVRMRLALVTETFPPEVNGAAMTLGRLRDGLVSLGWQVEVVRPSQKGESPAGRQGEFLVPGMPLPFYTALRMGWPVSGRLARRWREVRPDLVHIATEGPLGLAALRAAKKLGLPATSSFHTNFHEYGGHYGLHFGRAMAFRYMRWLHNETRRTFAPTRAMCRDLEQRGFRGLRVMSRGVDSALFTPERRSDELRASWGVGPDDCVVLCVGRLAAEKNLGLAVRAFLEAKASGGARRLVLVGDGPELAPLKSKYPEFHYAGVRRGADLAAHYASADVFVFPSLTETFGNVVTEAMASGVVSVAYDYAAAAEVLAPSGGGFVAPRGDEALFISKTVEACRDSVGRAARRRLAREAAERLSWSAVSAQFAADLEEVRAETPLKSR